MLGIKTASRTGAMALLKKDHDAVKKLFDRFEKAEDAKTVKDLVRRACRELKAHAAIEEELFYPALRRRMDDEDGLLEEADEEHHEAKILVAELELMTGDEENYRAKFEVLAENVRHHIKEEEGELFPKARKTDIDFDALGERLARRKEELLLGGVPPGAEAEMIGRFGVMKTSPAKTAQKTLEVPVRKSGRNRKH